MKRLLLVAAVPSILVLSACADLDEGGAAAEPATVHGTVLLGPTCPVVTVESPCPPRPLADVEVQALDAGGDVRASTVSDADGGFSISLAPGDYLLQAVVEDAGRSAKPVRVTVVEGQELEVDVPVDSGIRLPVG